ncbi:MAG: peptidase S41, partial [Anaerococcus sp.]|nr:peptidase S41 [Anaerococcus sp.]
MLQRQTLSKKIKLVVVMIFFITTTGFTYSNNIEDVPDYIKEDLLENINLKDKIHVNLNTKISQEEYETTIKDVENFLKENHVIFN